MSCLSFTWIDDLRVVRAAAARATTENQKRGPPPPTNVVSDSSIVRGLPSSRDAPPYFAACSRTIVLGAGSRRRSSPKRRVLRAARRRRTTRYERSFGKNCCLELRSSMHAAERRGTASDAAKHLPAMLDRDACRRGSTRPRSPSCAAPRSVGSAFGPQEVVAEQRDERHRDEARRDERAGEHDRQAVDELPGVAGQEQERQVGDDVRDRREQDRGRELRRARATPRRAAAGPRRASRLIASPATTGSSTSRPSAMMSDAIETCWRSMPEQVHQPEGHRERERDRERHQQRRAPLPEADERDEHDERRSPRRGSS